MSHKLNSYSCVLLDDEPASLLVLENYISRLPDMELAGSFTDVAQAIDSLVELDHIDFLFLDIRMPVSGIEVARRIRERASFLIFTTAFPQYALKAFSVHADHYLIKPIGFDGFLRAVNQVLIKNACTPISAEADLPRSD